MTGAVRPIPARRSLLQLEGVSVTYRDARQPAVRDLDLTLVDGETVLLLGPSGGGKTTVLNLCAGLVPDAIEATVSGRVQRDAVLTKPGSIGVVFQDPEAQFCMTRARDELAFGLENRGVRRDAMPAHMVQALDRVGFWPSPETQHTMLSGGQKQKLAIAAALVMAPKLLILDEPTSNLDPAARATVIEQIRQLRADGQATLIVEHQFSELLDVVDRIVLLSSEGELVADGPPAAVIADHAGWMIDHGVLPPPEAGPNAEQADAADAAETEAAITITHGTIRYPGKDVLSDITVRIPTGSFTAIVGPNGVGKSTLLQVLGGLRPLAGGETRLFGEAVGKRWRNDQLRRVSYCFQNPELQFMYERVGDELANRRIDGQFPAAIVNELERFGLAGTAAQSPFSLSQGQKRRLSVAVMLHRETDLYLLDEPTYGQDGRTRAAILGMLSDLVQVGKTIVMTTHDMDLVRSHASHVIVLADGQLAYEGTPEELFAQPDLLARAHLAPVPESSAGTAATRADWEQIPVKVIRRPVDAFNPSLLAVSMLAASLVGTFAQQMTQACVYLAMSLVWLFGLRWLSPWRAIKWFSPFIIMNLFYLWSFAAYSAVPPGGHSFNILWAHFTWEGLQTGVLVAVRMLSSVGYLILLLTSLDITELMVGFCQNAKVPPKFAYGILTGLRLAPLFREHWQQLTLSRRLRGRLERFPFLHVISYSIPLLSLAVRSSERAAIAMEARGLTGAAANRSSSRTYLRQVPVRTRDVLFCVLAIGIAVIIMVAIR